MAITLDTNQAAPAGFVANGYSADMSGTETLVAAVTGKYIYIEAIYVSCKSAITVTFLAGAAEVIGPLQFTTDGGNFVSMQFTRPIQMPTATALTADASGAGAVTAVVVGYVA